MKGRLFKNSLKLTYEKIGLILGLATILLSIRFLLSDVLGKGKVSMINLSLQVGMILTILGTVRSFVRFIYGEESEKRDPLLYNNLPSSVITTGIMLVVLAANIIREGKI